MILREDFKASVAVLLLVIVATFASCGGEASVPSFSFSGQDSIFKTVSTTFSTGTVDTTTSTDVGQYSSIAIDPDDNYPAVAYYDLDNGNLMYAKWDGSDWDDKTTVDSAGSVGKYASLAFDSSGNPSIGYYRFYEEGVGALMWAYDHDDDGDWDEGDWPMQLAYNGSCDYGQFCSHDISGIYFGFAFYYATGGDLWYLEYNTVTQSISPVDPDTGGNVGEYCSLKFHSGVPTVSYYDRTNGRLKYATENSPYWDVQVVDDPEDPDYDVGQYTSLDYDGSGNPSIAYFDVDNENPKWARWNPVRSVWVCETLVDTEDKWGYHISHEWYGSTKCGFAFEGEESGVSHLIFVRWTPAGQDEYTADASAKCGCYTSFAWVPGGANQGDGWISHRCFNDLDDIYLRYGFVND